MNASNQGQLGELLSAYLEGDLNEADRARVDELLRTNETARKEMETLRETVSLLGKMEELDPPASLWDAIFRRVADEAPADLPAGAGQDGDWRRWVRRIFQPVAVTLPVGAAVAAALIFLGVSWVQERQERRLLEARVASLETRIAGEGALRDRLAAQADAERVKRLEAALDLRNRESDALSLLVSEQLQALAETRAELERERQGGVARAERPPPQARAAPSRPKSPASVQPPPVALEITSPAELEAGVLGEIFAEKGAPWSASPEAGRTSARWMSVGPQGRGLYVLSGAKVPSLVRRLQILRGVVIRRVAESPAASQGRVLIRVEVSKSPAPPAPPASAAPPVRPPASPR